MIEYKIVHANAEIGQIEVLYTSAGAAIGVYAIDVPIKDGAYLTPEELHAEIMHRAPVWEVALKNDRVSATGFDKIAALVEPKTEAAPDEIANTEMWAQVSFEKSVAKALVKFGVLQSDPTSIEVTSL